MNNTQNYGKCHPQKENYDLLTLVIIRLGDSVFQKMDDKNKNGMMEFLHAIMYPHRKDFLDTVKKYIDFSKNEELWKEVGHMSGLGMSILEEGREMEVFESVQEGDYPIERGAQKLHLSIEQFGEKMRIAGYKVPEPV